MSLWQSVVLEIFIAAGLNTEAVLSALAGVYLPVSGQIFVSAIASQPCKDTVTDLTGAWLRST